MTNRTEQGAPKAWGGRFSESPDKRVEALNASVTFDIRMVREDIRGSIAHVRMLGRQGIVAMDEAVQIENGLWDVLAEVDRDEFRLTLTDEDVHTGVERRLRELIGPVTGKLHTGRSRNDQVANDLRFWTKRALIEIGHGLLEFAGALVEVAEAHPDVVMPGYTHLQRAQPVLLGHHLLAYVEMSLRDLDRVRDAYWRANVLALGSGALAGTSFPLDRESVAADLGFARITANSLDGVADRDFALDALFACSTIVVHLSRLSEEIILWSSGEFKFIELSDAFSTGSSIMPQKKNADIAELGRGKAGRVFGDLLGLLTTLKGLPLAYNKDMQEDKEGLFDAVDTVLALLEVFPPMMRTTRFNRERMAAAAIADFTLATDAADLLAKHGVPFREAHGVVGRLVAACIAGDKTFADLSDAEWAAIHPVFADEKPPLTALESVSIRDIPGGTAPNRVRDAIVTARLELDDHRSWFGREAAAYAALFTRP
ncbi:MAG: argininosuccinate lyase [Chloroflexia bacterium]|nr:argininosuccinate lyase [Chloroflexia bacterium]